MQRLPLTRNATRQTAKNASPNDFVLKKGVVLTGANASGKSTFMKAVAINVILAQTINTCVAKNI